MQLRQIRLKWKIATAGSIILLAGLGILYLWMIREMPHNPKNLCDVFHDKKDWYPDALAAGKKWKVPISVIMAVMYHESSFRAAARPPRSKILFIFPGPRPTSAYGYAQAVDATWVQYQKENKAENARRNHFADAVDFIGWYCQSSRSRCGIALNDAYNLYLAYHEGHSGFLRGSYNAKPWLIEKAKKVRHLSKIYARQMQVCGF